MAERGHGRSTAALDVAERLMSDYEGSVSTATVRTVVADADHQLAGQVPSGALPELLHRLANERLARLSAQ